MRIAAVLVAAALVLTACGGGGGGDEESVRTVDMRLIQYRPERIEVSVNDTVRWKQLDAGFHTVTSGSVGQEGGGVRAAPDGKFASEQLATDDTYQFKFAEAGTFPYFCEIHPATMRGEVVVSGGGAAIHNHDGGHS